MNLAQRLHILGTPAPVVVAGVAQRLRKDATREFPQEGSLRDAKNLGNIGSLQVIGFPDLLPRRHERSIPVQNVKRKDKVPNP